MPHTDRRTPRHRHTTSPVCSGLLLSMALSGMGPVQAAAPCHRLLTVGAWNLQWLGNAQAGRRKPQSPDDIASMIALSGVDILALSEVSATEGNVASTGTSARNATLDAAFAQLNAAGAHWAYALFPKREGARAPQDQWTGLAWNAAAVTPVGGPQPLRATIDTAREDALRHQMDRDEPNTLIWSRWPQAMKFSAGPGLTDVVVVPIHFKSNIGGEATAQVRAVEAELLVQALRQLPASLHDPDTLILGDSNMLDADEPAGQVLARAGFKDCNARDVGTHLSFRAGEKRAPFDRIFVAARQPESADTCPLSGVGREPRDFKVIKPHEWQPDLKPSQFQARLSDHLLVRTALCVMKDDD